MGIVYEFNDIIIQLDLGIVSPDMHVYKINLGLLIGLLGDSELCIR